MPDDGSLSQDDIDQLLSMGGDEDPSSFSSDSPMDFGEGGGDVDDLNLDSLLGGGGSSGGGDDSSVGLDQAALDALAGAVGGMGGPSSSSAPSSGSRPMGSSDRGDNVNLLMDVSLRFTVELGRTTMYIKDALMLGEGSIVELDKNVGDEVDILVNDRLFGRGKLVIMDEFFGVQLTHVIDPLERFRNL